ncbi:MAG: hypothetical protein ACI3U8_01615 [Candidatus Onthomonas sp.]
MAILIALAVVAMLGGAIFYNPLRRKMAGIIGVGGAYVVLIGIMLLVACFTQLFGGPNVETNVTEIIVSVVFMVIAIGYMIYVMLTRCTTVAQRIALPFVACLIGLGFAWRLLAAIVLHIPMESGKTEKKSSFPASMMSPEGEYFTLENDSGDNATYYCPRTGERAHFRDADFDEGFFPTGWRQA